MVLVWDTLPFQWENSNGSYYEWIIFGNSLKNLTPYCRKLNFWSWGSRDIKFFTLKANTSVSYCKQDFVIIFSLHNKGEQNGTLVLLICKGVHDFQIIKVVWLAALKVTLWNWPYYFSKYIITTLCVFILTKTRRTQFINAVLILENRVLCLLLTILLSLLIFEYVCHFIL